jgi:hypothetical protein
MNETQAVNIGLGAVVVSAGFLIVWHAVNRGPGDSRYKMAALVVTATALHVFLPAYLFEVGQEIRGLFYGFVMPAIGWLSFMALVLLAGAALGIMFSRYEARKVRGEQPGIGERIAPTIAQTRAPLLPEQPEPARATRQQTAIEVRHVR